MAPRCRRAPLAIWRDRPPPDPRCGPGIPTCLTLQPPAHACTIAQRFRFRHSPPMSEYLTTKELAELLRIKERKVYDLAASGQVPVSRAMGKLLFPRAAITQWIAANATGLAVAPEPSTRQNVFLGSHDPLLEWALRESRAGLATFFDGSLDRIERFAASEGIATGLHVLDANRTLERAKVRRAQTAAQAQAAAAAAAAEPAAEPQAPEA